MRWLGVRRLYHPYFRGKQYELITIRESAPVFKEADFCPIIEPVKETLTSLKKALDTIVEVDWRAVVIVNPHHGELSSQGKPLTELLKDKFLDLPGIAAGILLKKNMTVDEAMASYEEHGAHTPVFVHAGFSEAKALSEKLAPPTKAQSHIFFDQYCGKLYQKHFKGSHRVLLKDGFERKRNKDYELIEPFSDLHATFADEGMDGFGDFLIVGDEFSETGGPAYAITIHLTFIDPSQDDSMLIYHFVSNRRDTPKDPAGKFAEALAKMMEILDTGESNILETDAVKEFRMLHEQQHFPGLGYVKKLSMNHHIETLANYFKLTA
jgi:hypothetical protein